MKPVKFWPAIFEITMLLSLVGAVVHGFIGNPYAAATHVFIGTIAAAFRGLCNE